MGAQIVAHRQMPQNVGLAGLPEHMHLMRAPVAAAAEIPPAGDPEFAHAFVTQRLERGIFRIDGLDVAHDGQDVDDGLGREPRHRRAADMMDLHQLVAQRRRDARRLPAEFLRPPRRRRDDLHLHCHGFSFPAPARKSGPAIRFGGAALPRDVKTRSSR